MILREENNAIINAELGIAKEVLTEVDKNIDLISIKSVTTRTKVLGEAILNNFYTDYLVYIKRQNPNTKLDGFIVPKAGSLLSLINYEKIDDNYIKYSLPILDTDTRKEFANKVEALVNEVNFANRIINNSINKLNTILPTLDLAKPVFDYFSVQQFDIFKTYDFLKNNGYLTKFPSTTDVNTEHLPELIALLKTNIQTNAKIKTDLELNEFVQTDINNLLDKDDFIESVLESIGTNSDSEGIFIKTDFASGYESYVNQHIVILAYLIDLYNKVKGEYDVGTVNVIENNINNVIKDIETAVKVIQNNIAMGVVVYKIVKDDNNNYTIYVYEENYNKLKENNLNLETIIGFSIYCKEKALTPTTGTLSKLQIDSSKYRAYFDAFRNNIILTNKNNMKGKLVNLYILVISEFFDEVKDIDLGAIKNALTGLNISDLQNIKETMRDIIITFVYNNDNKLVVFFNGIKEASKLLSKSTEVEELAGYATYKLLLYYLAQQTTIK